MRIIAARDKASLKGKGANESIGNVYENVRGLVDEILAKNPEAGKYAEDIFFGVYRDKEKRSQIPKNIYDKGYLSLLDGAKNEVDMVKAEVHTIAKIGRSLGLINSANKIFNSGRGALRNIDVDKMFGSGLQGITTSLIRSDWQSYLYNHNQATGLDNQADSLQKELDEWMKKSGFALAAEEKSSDIVLNAGGGGDVIPGAVDVSQNIVKGGTSQKIFNIEVHKFQDAINFYAQGVEDLKGRVDELSDMIGERFLRVVDSANSAG